MIISDVVVQYNDQNNKTRWGYITSRDFKQLSEYLGKVKQSKEEQNQNNEVLKADIEQMAEMRVVVYLVDGTTGSADLRSLYLVEPFAKYKLDEEEK